MRAFYPVLAPMGLSAAVGYTTQRYCPVLKCLTDALMVSRYPMARCPGQTRAVSTCSDMSPVWHVLCTLERASAWTPRGAGEMQSPADTHQERPLRVAQPYALQDVRATCLVCREAYGSGSRVSTVGSHGPMRKLLLQQRRSHHGNPGTSTRGRDCADEY